ncbi:MAG TPA: hypothetical protein VF855_14525 [Acidimicrobiales bacterium]
MSVEPAPRTRVANPDQLAELEEERAFLLGSLADLERERAAGDLDDHDYEVLKDGYTARAAEVLRAIDAGRAALPGKKPRSAGRLAAVWVGVVAVAVLAGIGIARFSGQRLPGESVSGEIADSVNTYLSEARSLQASDPKGSIERYEAVLKIQPDNAEALTYKGWLLARVGADAVERGLADGEGLVERGEASIDRAIGVAPSYADPYCFKAIVRFRFYGDAAGAKPAVDACVASNPPAVVASLVQNLRAEVDAAMAASTTKPGG